MMPRGRELKKDFPIPFELRRRSKAFALGGALTVLLRGFRLGTLVVTVSHFGPLKVSLPTCEKL
jgi:hypothetical protein